MTELPRPDSLIELIGLALGNRFSILRRSGYDDEDVYRVWHKISRNIEHCMLDKKAMEIPGLGQFNFNLQKSEIGQDSYLFGQKPIFVLNSRLADTHKLKSRRAHLSSDIPLLKINYVSIASDLNTSKELVEASIKEVIQVLSKRVEQTGTCEFAFTTLGSLIIQSGRCEFLFSKPFREMVDHVYSTRKGIKKTDKFQTSTQDKAFVLPKIKPGNDIQELKKKEKASEHDKIPQPPLTPISVRRQIGTPRRKLKPKAAPSSPDIPTSKKVTPRDVTPGVGKVSYDKPQPKDVPPLSPLPKSVRGKRVAFETETLEKTEGATEDFTCPNCHGCNSFHCYPCKSRRNRNFPVYVSEERKKQEENEDRLLQKYQNIQDSQSLMHEEQMKEMKRDEAKKTAAFNLKAGAAKKERDRALQEEEQNNFHHYENSFLLDKRERLPPRHFVKTEDDLAAQVRNNARRRQREQEEQEQLERMEMQQMARDFQIEKENLYQSKRQKSEEYRRTLDTQVALKCRLDDPLDEQCESRRYSIPRPNVVIPFQRKVRIDPKSSTMVIYKHGSGNKSCDGQESIFGLHDETPEKRLERKRCLASLQETQVTMAAEKRKRQENLRVQKLKEENAMVQRTQADLRRERKMRTMEHHRQQQDLDESWSKNAAIKRAREKKEALDALEPGLLLLEQTDRYKRCSQCEKVPGNVGKSNIWTESRYLSGCRLMV